MERQMASLLYTCPETRQQAPTGIRIDAKSLRRAWSKKLKVQCPCCGNTHQILVRGDLYRKCPPRCRRSPLLNPAVMPLGAEFSPQGSEPTFLVAEKCRLASYAVTSSGRWASAENPCRRGRGYARRPGTSSALMRFVLFTGSRGGRTPQ